MARKDGRPKATFTHAPDDCVFCKAERDFAADYLAAHPEALED